MVQCYLSRRYLLEILVPVMRIEGEGPLCLIRTAHYIKKCYAYYMFPHNIVKHFAVLWGGAKPPHKTAKCFTILCKTARLANRYKTQQNVKNTISCQTVRMPKRSKKQKKQNKKKNKKKTKTITTTKKKTTKKKKQKKKQNKNKKKKKKQQQNVSLYHAKRPRDLKYYISTILFLVFHHENTPI